MFVRGQYKNLVIDISNKCLFVKDASVRVSTFADNTVTLGIYESKERALGVLDEICKALDMSCSINNNGIDLGVAVFNMPIS